MDTAYLQETVGPQLRLALTAMVVEQPRDAVQFIGEYLLGYVHREEDKVREEQLLKELDDRLEKAGSREEEKEENNKPSSKDLSEEDATVWTSLDDCDEMTEEFLKKVCEIARKDVGASAVYTATLDDDLMLFPEFKTNYNEGLLFDLFAERPEYEEEVARVDAEIDAAEDEETKETLQAKKDAIPQYPAHIYIENVVREPRIKFFGIPSIGSFAACPVRYGDDKRQALCAHTMGSSRCFDARDLARLKAWAYKLASASGRTEAKLKAASEEFRAAFDVEKCIEAAKTCEENMAQGPEIDETLPEEKRVVEQQRQKVQAAQAVLKEAIVDPLELVAKNDAESPPEYALKIALAACVFVLQRNDELLYVAGNPSKPDWTKVRGCLVESVLPAIRDADVAALTTAAIHHQQDHGFIGTTKALLVDEISADFYAHDLFHRLLAFLQHGLQLFDYAKALADAEAEETTQQQG